MARECTRLVDRLKEMEELYIKEQKKVNILEIENNRSMDEIKALRKERNELLSRTDKNKTTLKDRIREILTGDGK